MGWPVLFELGLAGCPSPIMNLPVVFAALNLGGSSIVKTVVWLVVLAIVWWLVTYFEVPEPFQKIIKAVLVIGAVALLIYFLLSLTGTSLP